MSITLSLSLSRPTAVEISPNVLRVASMFGLGVDTSRELVVVPRIGVPIEGGTVVFITGPSGGGKSSILRLIADGLARRGTPAMRFEDLADAPDRPLVDCFGDTSLRDVLASLSLAGLSDAFVMLRRPSELSDGQRYRFRLARVFHEAARERAAEGGLAKPQAGVGARDGMRVVLADEFGATLDRVTAKTLARNVRRWTRTPAARHVCFIAATTHDDLLEPFEPDVLVFKDLGERAAVMTRAVTRGDARMTNAGLRATPLPS